MTRTWRVAVPGALTLLAALLLTATTAPAFSLDDVAVRAETLASAPHQKPSVSLPQAIKALSYDQYRDIRFRPERALWRNSTLPVEIMFFHRGSFFEEPVTIHEIGAEGARPIPFDFDAFDYGKNTIDRDELRGLGFAGFRVHFPVNTPTYRDETLVLLGASYFRALGRGQQYGLSARGLAIDTAESTGEASPRFVEYFCEGPALARIPATGTVNAALSIDANGEILERQTTAMRSRGAGASSCGSVASTAPSRWSSGPT
jgi:glucans biosynthesis protein